MLGFRRYTIALHHRSGRTVDIHVWARNLAGATAKAWQQSEWEHWESATIKSRGETVHVDAPDDVSGRAHYPQPVTP